MLTSLTCTAGSTMPSEVGFLLGTAEVAEALRLSPGSYSEAYLRTLIVSAIQTFEARTGWVLSTTGYYAWYDSWPSERVLTLPKYPVYDITEVRFQQAEGMWASMPRRFSKDRTIDWGWGWDTIFTEQLNDGFSAVPGAAHCALLLPPINELPELRKDDPQVVRIAFYLWGLSALPSSIKTVLFMMISDLYDGRTEPNAAVESLILSHRRSGFAG